MRIAHTSGYFAAFIALGLFDAALGPTLPGLAQQTGSTLGQVSVLFAARGLGYMIGSVVTGRFYDRLPGHRLMAGVLIFLAAGMMCVPAIPLLAVVALMMGLLGFAEGAIDVGGNTLIVWRHGGRVGPFMNAMHFCFGVGAFIAPLVAAQAILRTGGIAWAYWALALLVLPAVAVVLPIPSPRPQAAHGEAAARDARPWTVFLVATLLFLAVAAEGSYGGWVYTYALRLGVGTVTSAAYLTSAFWGALTAGRLVSIPIAIRFRPATVLLADLLGSAVGMALVVLGQGSPAALWCGTIIFGFSMASVFPTTISLASTRMGTTGRVTGWFMVGGSAGGMAWPWLIGQLFEPVGPPVAMWLIALALLFALGVYGLLMADARRAQRQTLMLI